jgi:uncharacterized damage-inducible protein DinB
MKEFLKNQIRFELWANKKLFTSMQKATPLDERALLLLSHILSGAKMWLNRVKGEPLSTTLFEERTLDECSQLIDENAAGWLRFIEQADTLELNRIFEFIFPIDGSRKKIGVTDAIMHLVHHSSYHRGQIVARLKGTVEPLPLALYVVYASENID